MQCKVVIPSGRANIEFNLSEYEQKFLLTCDRGEDLLIVDQNHVAVKVVASEKEHPLITTNPKEVYLNLNKLLTSNI